MALDADGKPSFALLQGFGAGAVPIVFYAFDLLMVRGRDLRLSRLEERRRRLRKIVSGLPENIRYSETFAVPAATLVRVVRENGLEGIVAKRAGSAYRSGRSADWLKWRANRGQEFVIGGYVPASNTVDSLLVGYYEGRDLMYAGRIRAFPPSVDQEQEPRATRDHTIEDALLVWSAESSNPPLSASEFFNFQVLYFSV